MAKKEIKPIEFVVDITNAQNAKDVYYAFACAKIDKNLSADEVYAYESLNEEFEEAVLDRLDDLHIQMMDELYELCDTVKESTKKETKKPNVFVRFWNWITGK